MSSIGNNMIEQYEKAVLEWFMAVYPPITSMVYAEREDVLESMARIIEFPSLMYSRSQDDWVLPVKLPVKYVDEEGNSRKAVLYQTPQIYEAYLFLKKEEDLYKVANVIRQRWGEDSYLHIRYPDEATLLDVELRLLNFRLVTERTSVEVKGAKRYLYMKWQSVLLLEADYGINRYTGFRLSLVTPEGDKFRVMSTCKGDKCVP